MHAVDYAADGARHIIAAEDIPGLPRGKRILPRP
jgi:hypothetical protein